MSINSRFLALAVSAFALTAAAAAPAKAEQLVDYLVVNYGIPEYLSGQPGDPERGRKIAIARKKGNCLACHAMPVPEEDFHGEVGPTLEGVGSRMTEADIRSRLVNPKLLNPDTMMPSFYRVEGLNRVMKKFEGKPILTAQEVEDVVAYLKTLTDDE